MKLLKKSLLLVLIFVLTIISCSVDLKTLENYTDTYVSYSKADSKLHEAKPYGIVITKENGDYFLSVWYETIDGEKTTGKEKLAVAGGNYQPGEGKLINSINVNGDSITCQVSEALYDIIQIGPMLTEWYCKKFNPEMLSVFDVTLEDAGVRLDKFTQLNSDISRERGIFSYKRLENAGEVLKIDKDDKGIMVELKSIGNVSIRLSNLLDIEKYQKLKEGDRVSYRGRVVYIQLPFVEEDPVVLILDDVVY